MKRQEKVPIAFQEKIFILRKYESYCYQLAFFLLKDEEDGIQAASQTLIELSQDDEFFLASEMLQRRKVKSLTIKTSLMIRRQWGAYLLPGGNP